MTTTGAIKRLFEQFDAMLREARYIAMSGSDVDAGLVAAPRPAQYGREEGDQGRPYTAELEGQAAKLRHKDRDATPSLALRLRQHCGAYCGCTENQRSPRRRGSTPSLPRRFFLVG